MRLTRKLVDYLNRVFDKSARQVLAFRMNYAGTSMTWQVQDNILTSTVVGGSGAGFTIDLKAHTIASLVANIDARTGWSIPYVDTSGEVQGLAATVLLDANGDQDLSNGDHLYSYTSLLWAFLEPIAVELKLAAEQLDQMVLQMVPQTASGQWLDELGSYYAVDRTTLETDPDYATRIITSIGKPAGNNVALEVAINTIAGGLYASVIDSPVEAFTVPVAGTSWGLFDVVYAIDLSGSDDINFYTARVTAIVETLRDAGTHMKSIQISGALADSYDTAATASDTPSALNVAFADFDESAAFVINFYNADHLHDSSITYGSGNELLELVITTNGISSPPEYLGDESGS